MSEKAEGESKETKTEEKVPPNAELPKGETNGKSEEDKKESVGKEKRVDNPALTQRQQMESKWDKHQRSQGLLPEEKESEPEKKEPEVKEPLREPKRPPEASFKKPDEPKPEKEAKKEPPKEPGKEASKSKAPSWEEYQALQQKLAKVQDETQKRIDEKTREAHELKRQLEEKGKKKEEEPEKEPDTPQQRLQRQIQKATDTDLEKWLIDSSAERLYSEVENETDRRSYNRFVSNLITREQASRSIRREKEPQEKASRRQDLHLKSFEEVKNQYGSYILDERGNLDKNSAVMQESDRIYLELLQNPEYADLPDLPKIAVERAYATVLRTMNSDQTSRVTELEKTVEQLKRENQHLKSLTGAESGFAGSELKESSGGKSSDDQKSPDEFNKEWVQDRKQWLSSRMPKHSRPPDLVK